MDTLEDILAFVKDQMAFHSERAEIYSKNKFRFKKHTETAEKFSKLVEFIENNYNKKNYQLTEQLSLSLTQDELESLPPEVIEELSITDADKAEFAIIHMIEDRGGIASLDQVIVDYYRETGEIVKRSAMTNRLYRMSGKGQIKSAPYKKGVYALSNVTDKELEDLFGSQSKDIENENNA